MNDTEADQLDDHDAGIAQCAGPDWGRGVSRRRASGERISTTSPTGCTC